MVRRLRERGSDVTQAQETVSNEPITYFLKRFLEFLSVKVYRLGILIFNVDQ